MSGKYSLSTKITQLQETSKEIVSKLKVETKKNWQQVQNDVRQKDKEGKLFTPASNLSKVDTMRSSAQNTTTVSPNHIVFSPQHFQEKINRPMSAMTPSDSANI